MYRQISNEIEAHLKSGDSKILLIDGARQIGKTYIVREVGKRLFPTFAEINLLEDKYRRRLFENVRTVEDFYVRLSIATSNLLGTKENTLVFLDEIQAYPELLTLLKFLREDDRYTYICSGSLLGVTLAQTPSIPIGSIQTLHMYPMNFHEFLLARNVAEESISFVRNCFENRLSLPLPMHNFFLDELRYYLVCGGLPDAVKNFIQYQDVKKLRRIQTDICKLYAADASQYDLANKLKIRKIYDMLPSMLEQRKKRIVVRQIENKVGKTMSDYADEFEYLVSSGISIEVKAVSQPAFPLIQMSQKNLLKLYLNDVGILTNLLYRQNVQPILDEHKSINLGNVYESFVAQELKSKDRNLFYYDNKKLGEVDFLVNDYARQAVLPIEVKSGKDYNIHASLDRFIQNKDYAVNEAIVLSNHHEIRTENSCTYLPIYMAMFL